MLSLFLVDGPDLGVWVYGRLAQNLIRNFFVIHAEFIFEGLVRLWVYRISFCG